MHLKTQLFHCLSTTRGWSIKIANTSARCFFKNNVVSSFKHTFTNNIAGSVSAATASLTATEAARQAISKLGLNGSTG
jgi:hypothetical protein